MRIYLLLAFLVAAVPGARANSITIGQIQFLGTNSQGISAFKVSLDTAGVTASSITLRNLTLIESGTAESTGSITSPATILFLAGAGFKLPACPCKSAQIKLLFASEQKDITLQLANGQLFVTNANPVFFLLPLPKQRFLTAGESEPIVLTSVSEPATVTLFSSGLALLVYRRRSLRCNCLFSLGGPSRFQLSRLPCAASSRVQKSK